jgi:hypothetical protein
MNGHPHASSQATDDPRHPQQVLFIAGAMTTPPSAPGLDLHKARPVETVVRTLEEVKEDWKVAVGQVVEMVSATEERVGATGYRLEEVQVSLGFSASGKLAFIAEAGVEASVTIAFKRRE